jgi:hypothetical protein
MVGIIWPNGPYSHRYMRSYIYKVLSRTKTSFCTFKVALFYLLLIKECIQTSFHEQSLYCNRQMFLTVLILASKYLQDTSYSANSWSKMSGVPVEEINANERVVLQAVDWKIHMPKSKFNRWEIILKYFHPCSVEYWKDHFRFLNPGLRNLSLSGENSLNSPINNIYYTSPTNSRNMNNVTTASSVVKRADIRLFITDRWHHWVPQLSGTKALQ